MQKPKFEPYYCLIPSATRNSTFVIPKQNKEAWKWGVYSLKLETNQERLDYYFQKTKNQSQNIFVGTWFIYKKKVKFLSFVFIRLGATPADTEDLLQALFLGITCSSGWVTKWHEGIEPNSAIPCSACCMLSPAPEKNFFYDLMYLI